MIYASQLALFPDTSLMQDFKEGKFAEATEVERLEEMQVFLHNIFALQQYCGVQVLTTVFVFSYTTRLQAGEAL